MRHNLKRIQGTGLYPHNTGGTTYKSAYEFLTKSDEKSFSQCDGTSYQTSDRGITSTRLLFVNGDASQVELASPRNTGYWGRGSARSDKTDAKTKISPPETHGNDMFLYGVSLS